MVSRRCTAVRVDGTSCRAWAVRGTKPPRCAAHGGGSGHRVAGECDPPDGTTPRNDCTIDGLIDAIYQRQMQLDDYIDQMWDADVPIRDLAYLLRILGQNARQLGGLLRDRKALSGEAADGICDALNRALNELSGELETTL